MIALNPKALSLINTSFASPDAQVLISASANSPLLASMLNAFANKMGPNNTGPSIVLGNAGVPGTGVPGT